MAAIQKGHWKQMERMDLSKNEVSVMGVRLTASSQFHRINQLDLRNRTGSELREVVEKNKSALETQLMMKWELKILAL